MLKETIEVGDKFVCKFKYYNENSNGFFYGKTYTVLELGDTITMKYGDREVFVSSLMFGYFFYTNIESRKMKLEEISKSILYQHFVEKVNSKNIDI